jgi:tRNA A-37 threonylcarbamoyl transferase component Bud32
MSSGRFEVPEALEEFRIRSQQSNAAYRIPAPDGFVFLKRYLPKELSLLQLLRGRLAPFGVRCPVEYTSPRQRRDFEVKCLRHWQHLGYPVSTVFEAQSDDPSPVPTLITSFVEGPTLRAVLRDADSAPMSGPDAVTRLFVDMAARHRHALDTNDSLLFHVDANTRNIIVSDGKLFHVDFEMGRPWEDCLTLATREAMKSLVSIQEDLPEQSRAWVVEAFVGNYGLEAVRGEIKRKVLGRPLQAMHRKRADRKKAARPGSVSTFDIADLL